MLFGRYRLKSRNNCFFLRMDRALLDRLNLTLWGRPYFHENEFSRNETLENVQYHIHINNTKNTPPSLIEIYDKKAKKKRLARKRKINNVNPDIGLLAPIYLPSLPQLESSKPTESPPLKIKARVISEDKLQSSTSDQNSEKEKPVPLIEGV